MEAKEMEHLDKFTFLVLASFISDRLEMVENAVDLYKRMERPSMIFFDLQEFRLQEMAIPWKATGGVNSTLTSNFGTRRKFFACAWLKVWQGSSVCIAAFLCASS